MTTRALRSALLLVCFVLPASPAAAATFTVTTTADGAAGACAGSCTLRSALAAAAGAPGPDVIVVPAGTYQLLDGLGELVADSTVTVEGAGARATTIRGASNDRVMRATASLTLRGVTLTGGAKGSTGAAHGGALLVTGGDVTLERVTVRDNAVSSETNAYGGGIAVTGGTFTLLDSTVSGNTARGRYNGAGAGHAAGGGIYAAGPTTIRRSTIVGNGTQNSGAGTFSVGGGLRVATTATVEHTTFAQNSATSFAGSSGFRQGGNIEISSGSSLALSGSVLAAGDASTGPNCHNNGAITEPARNLSQTTECLGAASLRGVNPQLGALQNNGGPTDTLRPALGSPAVDAAAGCGARGADQRGNALPAGPACDLGAVEVGADRSVTLQASKGAAAAGEELTLVATVSNPGASADDAASETLTLELPAGVTATTATSTLGTCTAGAEVTCALGTLARGSAATVVATVRASGADLAFTARRGGPVPDQSAANDAATASVAGLGGPAPATGGVTPGGTGTDGGAGTSRDTIAPLLSGLRLAGAPSVRRGATLRFRLSEAATVRITAERLVTGRKAGARCAAKGRGARCIRALKVTTRTARAASGTVSVKVPGKALKAGKVRFTLVATDAAGNRSKTVRMTARVRAR